MKHQRLQLAVYLSVAFAMPAAFSAPAGGPPAPASGGQHHQPSIHHSHHAHMMPQQIQNFNLSSALAAQNLMDMNARAALQAQANALASQYSGLQKDAGGGNYDTSQMGDMMKGFADNVEDAKLQPTRDVAPLPEQPDNASAGTQQQQAAAQSISIVVQTAPAQPEAPPAPIAPEASADPAVAQANEQIIPDLQSALNVAEKTSASPAAAVSGARDAVAVLPFAAAGALDKKDNFAFEQPPAAGEEYAHGRRDLASSGDGEASGGSAPNGDLATSGAAAEGHAPGEVLVERQGAGGVIGGLPKPDAKPALPKNLLAKVKRVQGGETESGGFFSHLKKALFGGVARHAPRSSFFQPLDFPAQPVEASLGPDDDDQWWQPMALPLFFTGVFCGIVWWMHSRQRRGTRRVAVARANPVPAGAPLMAVAEKEPTTAVVTLASFRKPRV